MRVTEEEYAALLTRRAPSLQTVIEKHGFTGGKVPEKKPSKYRNKKVSYGGAIFDSIGEKNRYVELESLEAAGVITDLRKQVPFEILPVLVIDGKREQAVTYRADFTYKENGALVVEDFKGMKTEMYRLKRKMLFHTHGIVIRETGREGKR